VLVCHGEARIGEPRPVARSVGLAPPHLGVTAEPTLLGPRPGVRAGGQQQDAAVGQPPRERVQQTGLRRDRHVDDRVQRDDGVERGGRPVELGDVAADEGRRRDEPLRPSQLHIADVDARDPVSRRNEFPGDRDAAAAADVEHPTRRLQPTLQLADPRPVLPRRRVVVAVTVRHRVVPAADDVAPIAVATVHRAHPFRRWSVMRTGGQFHLTTGAATDH
jgi:hypothetical protein